MKKKVKLTKAILEKFNEFLDLNAEIEVIEEDFDDNTVTLKFKSISD